MDTLQNMRTFMCVAQTGSFTAAGQQMHLAVPTISRNIAKLEEHLKTRLINRNTRQLVLTEAGGRYLTWCRRIISTVDQAEVEARGAMSLPEGRLRLHAMVGVGAHFVVPAIAELRKLHPAITFELTLSNRFPDLLGEGIDIAIIASDRLPDSGYISRLLGKTQSILCASPSYLASNGAPQAPADLIRFDCLQLSVPATDALEWCFFSDGQKETIQPRPAFLEVDSTEAMIRALEAGMGVGVLPAFAARQSLRDGTLVHVLPDHQLQELNLYAIYAGRDYIDAKIKAFIRTLRRLTP